MDPSKIPENVMKFVMYSKKIQDLKDETRKCRNELKGLQPDVQQWLKTQHDNQFILNINSAETGTFGNPGKLRLGVQKKRETISKSNLSSYLFSFFSSLWPDKEQRDIEEISHTAADHIWQSRSIVDNRPIAIRTFSTKKQ